VGLALLSRGTSQTLSDFVAATVLMCGACFAPMVMLRLVHFAADAHIARDAMGSVRDGARPITSHLHAPGHGRHDFASSQGQAPQHDQPVTATSVPVDGKPPLDLSETAAGGSAAGRGGTSAAGAAGGSGAAGAAGTAVLLGQELKDRAHDTGDQLREQNDQFTETQRRTTEDRPDPADHTRHGPGIPPDYPPSSPGDPT
jgi:hypothetical protein